MTKLLDSAAVGERADANVGAHQGVCTTDNGTTFFTTSKDPAGSIADGMALIKWTRSGETYTRQASRDVTNDGSGTHTQINHIEYDPDTGLLLVGANNFDINDDTQTDGWLYRYDPSDLSFVDHVAVSGIADACEGCAIWDGRLWVIYDGVWAGANANVIQEYSIDNDAQGSFAISLTATHALSGNGGSDATHPYWNGIQIKRGIAYVNAHDEGDTLESHFWDGSGFKFVRSGTPPTAQCGQGFFIDDNGDWWFAERGFAAGDHRIVKADPTFAFMRSRVTVTVPILG